MRQFSFVSLVDVEGRADSGAPCIEVSPCFGILTILRACTFFVDPSFEIELVRDGVLV